MKTQFYYACRKTKSELRALLRPILKGIIYSSLYKLDQYFYLVLEFSPSFSKSMPGILPCQKTKIPTTPLELLLNWGIAELENNLEYIQYEYASKSSVTGFSLTFNNSIKIERLFASLTETMLIINHTPDSFSEQGMLFQQPEKIFAQVEEAIKNDVNIIDIGAESTRPDAPQISHQEEVSRLTPVIEQLQQLRINKQIKLSLDSYKPETILYFLDKIDIINDVSGNLPEYLLRTIAKTGKNYICMHSLTIPANKNINLDINLDPISVIKIWASQKVEYLLSLGFNPNQIIIDTGIGFNKLPVQSWYLLRNISKLQVIGIPLLIGHSRKSFMNNITNLPNNQRDLETALITEKLSEQMVDYVRVHSIEPADRIRKINSLL